MDHVVVRRGLAAVVAAALIAFGAAPLSAQSALQWHGYAQIRYANSSDSAGFSLRRAKLWMSGPVPGVGGLSFKMQGIFRNDAQGAVVLQDMFAEYRARAVSVKVGQMVPDFSLERFQPDYRIPLVERAAVVNALVPGATTLARDIGAQITLVPDSRTFHLSLGLFNGSGANRLSTSRGDYLTTARGTLTRDLGDGVTGSIGGSFEMRLTNGMSVGVLTPTGSFAGHESRWGVESRVASGTWALQGEYLEAHLEDQVSHGFYVLGTYALSDADEAALSVEQLRTPRPHQPTAPWYIVGFDHFLDRSKHHTAQLGGSPDDMGGASPTKLMADVRVRPDGSSAQYAATLQLQVFVH